jgi:hypothetical protein
VPTSGSRNYWPTKHTYPGRYSIVLASCVKDETCVIQRAIANFNEIARPARNAFAGEIIMSTYVKVRDDSSPSWTSRGTACAPVQYPPGPGLIKVPFA